jgi:hypothetical protein
LTRDSQLPDDEPETSPPGKDDGPHGTLRTTGPGLLAGIFLLGLVLGRLLPIVIEESGGIAPRVGWLSVLALFLVAAIMGFVAWSTHRTIHRHHQRLEPSQAVNRLVLAKACAIAGALLSGSYFGYALAWIGKEAELAQERLTHSLLAGVAGGLIVAGSLALERACRVRSRSNRP